MNTEKFVVPIGETRSRAVRAGLLLADPPHGPGVGVTLPGPRDQPSRGPDGEANEMNPKIDVRVECWGRWLVLQWHGISEEMRGKGTLFRSVKHCVTFLSRGSPFCAYNGPWICSYKPSYDTAGQTELDVFLPGTDKAYDDRVVTEVFFDAEACRKARERILAALKEWERAGYPIPKPPDEG